MCRRRGGCRLIWSERRRSLQQRARGEVGGWWSGDGGAARPAHHQRQSSELQQQHRRRHFFDFGNSPELAACITSTSPRRHPSLLPVSSCPTRARSLPPRAGLVQSLIQRPASYQRHAIAARARRKLEAFHVSIAGFRARSGRQDQETGCFIVRPAR